MSIKLEYDILTHLLVYRGKIKCMIQHLLIKENKPWLIILLKLFEGK